MPNDRLARVAYAAYCEIISHPMEEFHDLKTEEHDAWLAAADAVVMAIGTRSGLIQDETGKP